MSVALAGGVTVTGSFQPVKVVCPVSRPVLRSRIGYGWPVVATYRVPV